jgi:inhibitor of cysteine peptidase
MAHSFLRTAAFLAMVFLSTSLLAKTISLTDADNGTRVVLNPGDTLVLTLESNPTTGYHWVVSGNIGPVLQAAGEEFQPHRDEAEGHHIVGAGGHQIFRFSAVATGEVSLALAYLRPWEKGIKPVREFGVTVVVNENGAANTADNRTGGSPAQGSVLIGHYRGLLPCADCSGIETDLWLYAKDPKELVDTGYKMTMVYQGKGTSFEETGTWSVSHGTPDNKDAIVYQLKAANGSVQQFLHAGARKLIMLDAEGRRLPATLPTTLKRVR